MGQHPNVPNNKAFPVTDSKLVFRLRVTRRFINMVVIPQQTMFRVYVTTTSSDPLNTPVYTISYSGTIQVPQSCEINAGKVVEFDFGDIGASCSARPELETARRRFRHKQNHRHQMHQRGGECLPDDARRS
jgi:minor fimbrial subunit